MPEPICKAEQIRRRMAEGEVILGGHTFYTDPCITEALGLHGFSFVWIDAEHSAFDHRSILDHIIAASSAGTASIVRIPITDPVRVKPILEMGPDGIIFPMVCTKEDAQMAVSSCLYPPSGLRGFGPRRANGYGAVPAGEYLDHPEKRFLRIVQIEHVSAVRNLREILSVEGIDLPLVGPNDLSASIGHLGETAHPEVRALCEELIRICKELGRPFGVSLGADDHEAIAWWIRQGVSFLGCGDDISYISSGARASLAFANDCLSRKDRP